MEKKIGFECKVFGDKEVVVNLSQICNSLCLNCPNDDEFRQTVISPEETENFIKSNVKSNTERVVFIGGEPTISKNLIPSIILAKKLNKNVVIQINSNGRMFYYDKFAEQISKFNGDKLDLHIALYGSNEKVHDKITQIEGSFKQTTQGIKNLIKLNTKISIRNIVSKQNYTDLEDYGAYIANEFRNYKDNIIRVVLVGMDIIGNAWKNRELLAVSHLDVAPHIENCTDVLASNGFNPEIHLLPKGIFKKEYQKFAIMSGCVGGDFVDSYGCNVCVYKGYCSRLLNSYNKIFGNKEHHPIYRK